MFLRSNENRTIDKICVELLHQKYDHYVFTIRNNMVGFEIFFG